MLPRAGRGGLQRHGRLRHGPTGAGKSTLIDAICYALYGRVPRGTAVKDLIARDASEMKVQLEFDSSRRTFRVHRGVNVARTTNRKTGAERTSRDISPVQFEERIDGEWAPLHDRVADMDRAIEEAVGLDFDGFTKCVLLPQGRFAEFLTGSSKDRDKILIDLLDLGIYARIMQSANRKAQELASSVANIERRLSEDYANATPEALAETREQLAAARPALDTERLRRAALQDASEHASTVRKARADEKRRADELAVKTAELNSAENAAKDGAKTLAALTTALQAAEVELAASPYDAALHARLSRADASAKQLERARATVLAARAAAADRSAVDAANKTLAAADKKHAASVAAAAAADASLREAHRTDAATHLRQGLKAGDACPVCGGVVGKLAKAETSNVARAERALQDARKAETAASRGAAEAATALAVATQRVDTAAQRSVDADNEFRRAEEELNTILPSGMPADPAAIAAALSEQDGARLAHHELSTGVESARQALHQHRDEIAGTARAIVALNAEIVHLQGSIEEDRATGDAALALLKQSASTWKWGDVIELIDARKSPAELLKGMLDAAQHETEALASRIATLEAEERAIEHAIDRSAELQQELGDLKERHQLCRELGVLLRADNFQQFVIGEAMRVLADAATQHLRTLFDRYAIDVVSGEFAVVDHWQADQVRPAKTLSGGETFVASLALALALAERLPELRSATAASLESLFLDEGFGTLDTETLDTVMEALEGLRSEERMVGVITHVPELTQRIEHRIAVRKSPAGSTVEVAAAL
jgi:exonuclease SbcC